MRAQDRAVTEDDGLHEKGQQEQGGIERPAQDAQPLARRDIELVKHGRSPPYSLT